MELRIFTSKGQQDLSFKRAPPLAGFGVSFKDLVLNTEAAAPLICARLAAVMTKLAGGLTHRGSGCWYSGAWYSGGLEPGTRG